VNINRYYRDVVNVSDIYKYTYKYTKENNIAGILKKERGKRATETDLIVIRLIVKQRRVSM